MSSLTKSVRNLVQASSHETFDTMDGKFSTIFSALDKDGNGTLDKEEAYALVMQWEEEKRKSRSLKKQLGLAVVIGTVIIALLSAAVFGSTFIAVQANKDTKVENGKLRTKDGTADIGTVAKGNHFSVTNSSADTPLCLTLDEYVAIQDGVLDGEKVILDITQEGGEAPGHHDIKELHADGAIIMDDQTCFHKTDGSGLFCLTKQDCLTPEERRHLQARGLSTANTVAAQGKVCCNYYCSKVKDQCGDCKKSAPEYYGIGDWMGDCYGSPHCNSQTWAPYWCHAN